MGGVQVIVSWSTDGLVTVMFPTGPGEAGEEGGEGVERGGKGGLGGGINHTSFTTHSLSTWYHFPQQLQCYHLHTQQWLHSEPEQQEW